MVVVRDVQSSNPRSFDLLSATSECVLGLLVGAMAGQYVCSPVLEIGCELVH